MVVDFTLMLWHSLMRRAANRYRGYRIQKHLLNELRAEHSTDWRTMYLIELRMNIERNKSAALFEQAKGLDHAINGKVPRNTGRSGDSIE